MPRASPLDTPRVRIMVRAPRRRIDYISPIGCVDRAVFDEEGEPHEIRGFDHCLPWHAEVPVDENEIFVSEWHAVDCEVFQELFNDR
jgi:hypothetical protein